MCIRDREEAFSLHDLDFKNVQRVGVGAAENCLTRVLARDAAAVDVYKRQVRNGVI